MKYESDIEKMEVALEQAKLAYENDEIPVGAALFNENNELVVSDHNRRELDQDPTSPVSYTHLPLPTIYSV